MGLGPLGTLSGALQPLGGANGSQTASNPSPSSTASGPSWLQTETATIVTILLGLILIVAGLFQFKGVQTATGYAAKAAAA